MVGDDETNFSHKLLWTNRQVANLRKALQIIYQLILSYQKLKKMIQSGGFLGKGLGSLLKTGLPLMKNVVKPLAKSVLIPLGLTAVASAADAGIHKKILGSGHNPSSSALHNNAKLIISNEEMKDIIRIIKSLEDSSLLPEGTSKTIQKEAKELKWWFLSMLLGTLDASLLGDILIGWGINSAGEGIVRAGYGNKRQDHKNKMNF